MAPLVDSLLEGPLDIVGDIHGEIDALRALLAALGYDARGEHPQRRLIFLGDLCDRGPDSPAVIELVRSLVARGRAQCILGNHELNLVRCDAKHGNRWYLDPAHPEQQDEFKHCKVAPPALRPTWHEFFLSLPLALERADLRVVHAAWHPPSIDALRGETRRTALEVFDHHERETRTHLDASGLTGAAAAEQQAHAAALTDRSSTMTLLPNFARREEQRQMGNPVRVVTSGPEGVIDTPFWSSGKWRMCDRVRWWQEYTEPTPVIVGHYWRIADPTADSEVSAGKPNLFAGSRYDEWVGARRNVFCVDFSVGGRYVERALGVTSFTTRLAAVRWPEQQVVFDDGSSHALAG